MATKFPKFSQALAQDPATRRIWYGIATAHDLEAHDGNLFHVAWQGNFEKWVSNPLKTRPIAHAIWDPHFGESALKAFSKGNTYPVNITFAGWLHLQPKFRPSLSWFKNNESRLNHHLSGLLGFSSLAWTGHLVHVAIPASRGVHVGWDNFLTTPPHPAGLTPFFTGNWTVYAENPDTATHAFNTSEGSGTAILTFLGGFHPQTQSLWLSDIAHHHLAIAVVFIVAGHMYRTNFGIGHNMKEILDAHRPPGGRLGAASSTSPATAAGNQVWLPGWLEAINNPKTDLFLKIGPGDFLVHHAIALGLHVTALILVKGALDARGSKLMPDKKDFGYSFPCDGPGRGGTCDISAWDAFYLAMFWMLNTIGWYGLGCSYLDI
eukprot:scaffold29115_cov1319-Skeletonema_menzelii.AAC.2